MFAFVELRLPKQLLEIIGSEGGRNVLCTLMEVDTVRRVELLRHIKNQLRVLIDNPKFRSFLSNFITNFKPAQKQDRHLSVLKVVNTEGRVLDTDIQIVDRFLEELISREKN
ncbi:uncharacterized protein LOC111705235 [Eurytemora carolleeae]|uniref:uncharacterized protein LOC111705235 n=1 Tax=Eurytemora carolleeae TaxID=1294199 RepID=UPI000C77C7CF|nr:uncharacterized protein LOC111705235 [Eurytemora carolleeae]|eukprot:XP_023333488.1 uncharacterized protein LOC111705235 [Eurytemora affinis]